LSWSTWLLALGPFPIFFFGLCLFARFLRRSYFFLIYWLRDRFLNGLWLLSESLFDLNFRFISFSALGRLLLYREFLDFRLIVFFFFKVRSLSLL
jgi:hypothetical protein